MGYQVSVSMAYKDIFDDFDQVDIIKQIEGIPTINALQIIAHFVAQLHTNERSTSDQIKLLNIWASRLPRDVIKKISAFIYTIQSKPNADFNFLNNVSALLLEEVLIKNANDLPEVTDLTAEQELNLFKAYLYCSQQWTDKNGSGFQIPKIQNADDLTRVLLTTQLPYQEILELKDFRIQFIKAIYFFRFCEANPQFNVYLNLFLSEYGLPSWQQYLSHILMLYVRKFERLRTPSTLHVPSEFPDAIAFLNHLSVDTANFSSSDDFLTLRERPVFKISQNDFIFLNLNFLVDKLYQGIQFDFAKVLVKKAAMFNGKQIKSTIDFIGIFGNEFSETGLFYSVMDFAFEKSGYVKFTGHQMKAHIPGGEPDYYMRDKSKIYIFEFKNIFIGAGVKHSNDYEKIKSEIFKKLVANQNNSPKGVTQLVNVIEKIQKNEFTKFDKYDFSNVTIYPVIVYVDFSFNLPGTNFILNEEFRQQLKHKGLQNLGKIKNLILIDLDSFIKFQDLFRSKAIKINICFNEFYEYTKSSNDLFKQVSTFNMYIHHKTRKMDYGTPRMLMDEVFKLLPEVIN